MIILTKTQSTGSSLSMCENTKFRRVSTKIPLLSTFYNCQNCFWVYTVYFLCLTLRWSVLLKYWIPIRFWARIASLVVHGKISSNSCYIFFFHETFGWILTKILKSRSWKTFFDVCIRSLLFFPGFDTRLPFCLNNEHTDVCMSSIKYLAKNALKRVRIRRFSKVLLR